MPSMLNVTVQSPSTALIQILDKSQQAKMTVAQSKRLESLPIYIPPYHLPCFKDAIFCSKKNKKFIVKSIVQLDLLSTRYIVNMCRLNYLNQQDEINKRVSRLDTYINSFNACFSIILAIILIYSFIHNVSMQARTKRSLEARADAFSRLKSNLQSQGRKITGRKHNLCMDIFLFPKREIELHMYFQVC